MPSSTWDTIKAQPKSISFSLSGWSCMLTNMILSGLMSVCRTPKRFRASKATKSCRDKKKMTHLDLFLLSGVRFRF